MTVVRDLSDRDRPAWQELYAGYGAFYGIPLTAQKADRVWRGLIDPKYESCGLVAVDHADHPIALAHYREFARPLAGGRGLHLDDLYTAPSARGTGAASALIAHLKAIAAQRGLGVVRWITAEDNHTAQRLYDAVASRTGWVTYDMAVG